MKTREEILRAIEKHFVKGPKRIHPLLLNCAYDKYLKEGYLKKGFGVTEEEYQEDVKFMLELHKI